MSQQQALSISQQFLPLQSSVRFQSSVKVQKSSKKSSCKKGKSILYKQLHKINLQTTQKKRSCIINYLNNEGQLKNVEKAIYNIQKQGQDIPILQVALALSRYDKRLVQQLLDSKSIEAKQSSDQQLFLLNQSLKNDPILSLLSDSQTLKRLSNQQTQPSFVDYKHTSPRKKFEMMDSEKGKFKEGKVRTFSKVRYPKQLKDLKRQLYSLPYINKYKNLLQFKHQQSLKSHIKTADSQIKHINELNSSIQSFGTFQKNIKEKIEEQRYLEKTFNSVVQRRNKSLQISHKQIALPHIQPNKIKNYDKIPENYDQADKEKDLNVNLQTIERHRIRFVKSPQNFQKSRITTIRDTFYASEENPQQKMSNSKRMQNNHMKKNFQYRYWPSYPNYSPHNNHKIVTQLQKLKSKIKSFIQLPDAPTEQTLNMYNSLKNLEQKDLDKLKVESLKQEKQFSNTKYQIKYRSLKQNYMRRLKQFGKDKKLRQFQLQQSASQQKNNFVFKHIKLNQKMLQKMA